MDSLLKLIDNRIQKAIAESAHINSEISQVIGVDGATVTVKMLTTGSEYTLPNYSGSDVRIGDRAYVYWKGGFLSQQSAYIGASSRTDFPLVYVHGVDTPGDITSANAQVEFKSVVSGCVVNLVFNAVISATTAGNYALTIYVDDVAESYVPTGTTIANGRVNCNFVLPLAIPEAGSHTVSVRGGGNGTITQMKSYIFGQGIVDNQSGGGDATDLQELDLVWEEVGSPTVANTIQYISSYTKINIPRQLNNYDVNIIRATTFCESGVIDVTIPDGITEIE